jgi:RHS repeat-associated protein
VALRQLSNTLVDSYSYDGNGLRVAKLVGNTRTVSIYAGTKLISEYEDLASASYNPGTTPGSAPVDSLSVLLYQHADHLTTRLTTENDGNLSDEQGHYPFGEGAYATGKADPSVLRKFTSFQKDSETGSAQQHNATFRQQAARLGRYLTPGAAQSEVMNSQSLNRYAYVFNDPAGFIDPEGFVPLPPPFGPCAPFPFRVDVFQDGIWLPPWTLGCDRDRRPCFTPLCEGTDFRISLGSILRGAIAVLCKVRAQNQGVTLSTGHRFPRRGERRCRVWPTVDFGTNCVFLFACPTANFPISQITTTKVCIWALCNRWPRNCRSIRSKVFSRERTLGATDHRLLIECITVD